ncbi:MAG: ThiF family adenylyltransferase [Verrucomicrobiia bacterium]
MNEAEYYRRVSQIFRPEQLRTKKTIVVGVGSGGSRVASELGRLGVSLTLVDLPDEMLEEHNIVRHVLGYDALGKPKTTELARYIRNLNPKTVIECVELDVTTNQAGFNRLVKRVHPDLLLACTDNQASKHAINEVALRLGIPVVGAGVYDGGIAGEVYITRAGAACYGCIATELQLKDSGPKKSLNIDYNNIDLAETRSTSALNLDISQIALIHARVALNLLLSGEVDLLGLPPEANLIVFANRRVPGHFERPLHGEFFHIKKHQNCLVCGLPAQNVNAEADRILASLPFQPGPAQPPPATI